MGTLQIGHMGSSAGSQTSIPSLKNIEHAGRRRLDLGGIGDPVGNVHLLFMLMRLHACDFLARET